ncbi:MAG TPA: TolC family protein [Chryseolinea sp.]|nr:TolC family protein [Chryseolinea sp.]
MVLSYSRKVKTILCIVLLSISQVAMAQGNSLNIDTCYAMARRNYPIIKQFALIERSKEYTISNANKAYLPQVSVTAIGGFIGGLPSSGGESESGNLTFIGVGQINQNIWDGGTTRVQKDIAVANAEVEEANIEVQLYSLRDRMNQIYFGILLLDEQKQQLDTLLQNLNRTLKNSKLSMENGLAYQSDVDEVHAEVLRAEQNLIASSFARKGYVEMLSHLIGKTLREDVRLQSPQTIESTSTWTSRRPELNLFASQQRLLELQSNMNKVGNMPKLGLVGFATIIEPGVSFGPSSLSNVYVGGLSLSWNTGNLYKTSNNRQLDKIQMAKINNQQEVFTFNNNLQLKQSNSEIEKQKAIVSKDKEIILLKKKITQSYQLKYNNGLASMTDLINSVYKESEARNAQSLHEVQLLLALYNYKTATGN